MKEMKKSLTWITGIVAIACIAIGFFIGMKYQQTKRSTAFARNGMQTNTARTGMANGAKNGSGGLQIGTISSMDDKSITVKIAGGGSKIVFLSASTLYKKTADATLSEVKVGDTVAVSGTTNGDGSITATSVQLNPAMMRNNQGNNPGSEQQPPQAPQN